jgi:hypothetical protein
LALVLEEDNDTGKLLTLTPNVSPTFVVETSHNPAQNRHFHFLDDHPVLPQEAQELAELAYRKMGGDTGGKDIAHPWRVPGTLNFPTWQKLQRGRPIEPQPVKLIGGTGERVNVKALRETLEAMPDLHPPKRPRKKKATCGDAHQQRSGLGDGGVDRNAILDRLNELLRIQIDLEGTDRSVHCARVLFNLFYAGLTIEEVLAVAKGSAFARKFDERGDLVEEVERAYDRWHAEVNAPPSPPSLSPPKNGPLLDEHDVAIGCTLHVEPKFDPEEEDRAKPPPPKDEEEFSSDPQGSAFSATDRAEAYRVVGYMNRKYALIRSYAGKTLVMQEAANERGQPQEYWYTIYDFHAGAAANEGYIEVDNPTTGKTKWMAVSRWWITRKRRREYQSVVFDPSTDARNVRGH